VEAPPDPTGFGESQYSAALVNITNRCNLTCSHCFVFRDDNPNASIDRMDDTTMLHQLEVLRDRHGIKYMLFMGGEPMIRRDLVSKAIDLFEMGSIVTNGTFGIPSAPGHLVTVSLDGPREVNDSIRGQGVFNKVKQAIHDRVRDGTTTVILQMAVMKSTAHSIEAFVESIADWPIDGVAFTFYVPTAGEQSELAWETNDERDEVIDRVIALKRRYPDLVKSSPATLELMKSHHCSGYVGEHCALKAVLPLYVGDGGVFERTFCCYGNDVDCERCGSYAVFNAARRRLAAI